MTAQGQGGDELVGLRACPHCGGPTRWDRYGNSDVEPEMAINCEGECDGIFIFPKVAAGDWDGLRALWNRVPNRLEASAGRGDVMVEVLAAVRRHCPDREGVFKNYEDLWNDIRAALAAPSAPDAEGGGVPHKTIEAITALYESDRDDAAAFENAVRGAYVAGRLSALAPTAAGRDAGEGQS